MTLLCEHAGNGDYHGVLIFQDQEDWEFLVFATHVVFRRGAIDDERLFQSATHWVIEGAAASVAIENAAEAFAQIRNGPLEWLLEQRL